MLGVVEDVRGRLVDRDRARSRRRIRYLPAVEGDRLRPVIAHPAAPSVESRERQRPLTSCPGAFSAPAGGGCNAFHLPAHRPGRPARGWSSHLTDGCPGCGGFVGPVPSTARDGQRFTSESNTPACSRKVRAVVATRAAPIPDARHGCRADHDGGVAEQPRDETEGDPDQAVALGVRRERCREVDRGGERVEPTLPGGQESRRKQTPPRQSAPEQDVRRPHPQHGAEDERDRVAGHGQVTPLGEVLQRPEQGGEEHEREHPRRPSHDRLELLAPGRRQMSR